MAIDYKERQPFVRWRSMITGEAPLERRAGCKAAVTDAKEARLDRLLLRVGTRGTKEGRHGGGGARSSKRVGAQGRAARGCRACCAKPLGIRLNDASISHMAARSLRNTKGYSSTYLAM